MKSIISKRTVLAVFLACGYATIAFILSTDTNLNLTAVAYMCIVGTTVFLTILLRSVQGSLINPFIIFYLSICLFHFGQLVLYIFCVDRTPLNEYSLIYTTHSYIIVRDGSVYLMNLINLIAVIGCIFLKDCRKELVRGESGGANFYKRGMEKLTAIGWFVVVIVMTLAIIGDANRYLNVTAFGYTVGYTKYGSNLFYYAAILRIFVILTIIYLYRQRIWKYWFLVTYIVVYIGVTLFLIQNRGSAIIEMLTYTVFYLYIVQIHTKLDRNRWAILFVLVIMILFLPFISSTRLDAFSGNILEYVRDYNIFSLLLIEFGGTAETLLYTMERTQDFSHGYQLLASLSTIIPGSVYWFGDLSNQYQFTYGLKVMGLGGSFLAETYFNFGQSIFAYLYTTLIGFLAVLISNAFLRLKQRGFYTSIGYCILFSALLSMVRGNIYSLFTSIKLSVYYFIFINLFKKILFTEFRQGNVFGGTQVG